MTGDSVKEIPEYPKYRVYSRGNKFVIFIQNQEEDPFRLFQGDHYKTPEDAHKAVIRLQAVPVYINP